MTVTVTVTVAVTVTMAMTRRADCPNMLLADTWPQKNDCIKARLVARGAGICMFVFVLIAQNSSDGNRGLFLNNT